MKRIGLYVAFLACMCAYFVALSQAQVATGIPPFASIGGGPFDQLNLGNLNAHFTIPVFHKAGRGIPFAYDVAYDTSVWAPTGVSGHQTWLPSSGTWGWQGLTHSGSININYSTSVSSSACGTPTNPGTVQVWSYTNFSYQDTQGVTHPINFSASYLQSSGATNCPPSGPSPSNATIRMNDDSGYSLVAIPQMGSVSTYIISSNGATIMAGSNTDANGNKITNNGSTYTDTLGQTAVVVAGAGTPTSPITISYTPPGSTTPVKYTANYSAVTVKTNFGCTGITDFPATSENLVSSISLPDGSSYSFTYEQTLGAGNSGFKTGRLASVMLPTGGTITYQYSGGSGDTSHNAITCVDGSTATLTRIVNPGGGGSTGTWTYTKTGSLRHWNTLINDPVNEQTSIDFAEDSSTPTTGNFYELQRIVYPGAVGGTPLSTTLTCWNANVPACDGQSVLSPIFQTDVYSKLSTGVTNQVETTYQPDGSMTEQKLFDWGGTTPVQDTTITYATNLGTITNHPTTVVTRGVGGTVVAQTKYFYDETPATATSGTPQHQTITGSRGNLTTVETYTNGTTFLTKKFSYYDTGTINQATDVNNAVTTYVYGTTAQGSSTISCGNSFPTTTNYPLSLSTSAAWNCVGGVSVSTTDVNNNLTLTNYTDANFWRPSSIQYPDGGKTTFGYPSPNETDTDSYTDSTHSINTATITDGFGRTIKQERINDPLGLIEVDTSYDTSGNVSSVSNPHLATPQPTDGTVQYSYDALGRKTKVTNQDASFQTINYTDRATEIQDEGNGNGANRITKVYQNDGLGRLVSVCEVTSVAQMSVSPSACGQDIAQTGFLTNYSYDALGNLLSVTQSGLNTRTYTYDFLSRLKTEINPETNYNGTVNTISYSYDWCSAGDLCSRAAPMPNQTGSATVTTSYNYDLLHRLTSKTYNDGITPSVFRVYDGCCSWGYTQTNTKGRLQEEWVGTLCCASAGQLFSYDSMGRVIQNVQCTPLNCASPNIALNYTYDLAGDLISSSNGYGWIYSYAYDTAQRVSGITSNVVDSTHPASLLSSVQYNPLGEETAATMGNGTSGSGITETRGYDSRGRQTSLSSGVMGGPGIYNLSSISYAPNNNLLGVNDSILAGTWGYTYDDFNRLSSTNATGSDWGTVSDTYNYDRFGNRWQQNVGGVGNPSYVFDSNNHISSFTYDAAGNVTNDGFHAYTYDPEGRMLTVDGTAASYVYDASGRRVQKTVGSNTVNIGYDLMGRDWLEYTPSTVNRFEVYLPDSGRHLVTYAASTTFFDFQDQVGSERVKMTQDGLTAESSANLPFGDGQMNWGFWGSNGNAPGPAHFTGFDADTESGASNLSHAWFRQYSATQGRWMMPDPAGMAAADPTNPQSWNRYAYVMNSPLNNVDPLGLLTPYVPPPAPCGNGQALTLFNDGSMSCQMPCPQGYNWFMGWMVCGPPGQIMGLLSSINMNNVAQFFGVPSSGGGGAPNSPCKLVAPSGQYHASPGTIPLFQPSFADSLSAGIGTLNNQGITPVFTDGYRTLAMQNARRSAASSGASPFGAAQGISAHQVGLAADFGVKSNVGNNAAILSSMTAAGLVNGVNFQPSDPVHYSMPNARQSQNRATAASCAAAYSGD